MYARITNVLALFPNLFGIEVRRETNPSSEDNRYRCKFGAGGRNYWKNIGLWNHYLWWGYSKKMTHFVSIPYFIPACRKIVHRRFCKWCPRKFPWKSEKGKSARRMTESVIGDLALVVCRMSKPFWLTYLNMENTSDGVWQEKAWDQQFPSETVTKHPRDPTPVDDNTGNLQRVKDMTRE